MLRYIRNMIASKLVPIDEARLLRVLRANIDPASIRNILVIRLGRLGDAVLSTPCVTALRRHFPHANITMMLSPYNKVIYEGNPHIDSIIVYDGRGCQRRLRDKLKFMTHVRRRHFDFVVVLHAEGIGYWTAFMSGAKHRVSTFSYHHGISPLTTRFLLSVRVPYEVHKDELEQNPRQIAHEVDYCLSMIRPYGIEAKQKELVLVLSEEDRRFADDLFQRHGITPESLPICVHFRRRWFIDGWDREYFYQLIARLPNDIPRARVIVTLGPFERTLRQELQRNIDAIITEEAMKVKEWAAVIDRCRLVITTDTAATHIASAMKTPVVLVLEQKHFSYFSQRWRPWEVPYIIVKKRFGETDAAHDALINARKQAVVTDIINAARELLLAEENG